ncbi:MAG: nickel-dependent lactate racemase [Treponema sp.]|nr:nickel-dependent lactate racemase [Treponema sp.]
MIEKTYIARGEASLDIGGEELGDIFSEALSQALADVNSAGQVIIVPPDTTRFHSRGGFLTDVAARQLINKNRLGAILPALGTHTALTAAEINKMFPGTPKEKFLVHKWRTGIAELGRLDAPWVQEKTGGAVAFDWPVQVNRLLQKSGAGSGGFSMIISIGQVVPHEVAGMANHAKNLFIGTGGKEAIDKSHFAGAAYGMERIMGRIDTPVRAMFDEGLTRFADKMPPVLWVLTVIGNKTESDATAVRGLYIGFDRECFEKACELAGKVNIELIDKPVKKAVVFLDPDKYRTAWLGNKAIYRTAMAIADGGEILIMAGGLERFGEDIEVDGLIRKYGYRPGREIISRVETDACLAGNLCTAAHLIHGCGEGRFTVRYCPGAGLSRKEIESAGYQWGDLKEANARYNAGKLPPGWNTMNDGERIFFVSDPALGLWAARRRFTGG